MEFTKTGRARASSLRFALTLEAGQRHGRQGSDPEDEIQKWTYLLIAWIATGGDEGNTPTEQETVELETFVVEHQEEIAEIHAVCKQKLQVYLASGGNPKSDDSSEIAREALAILEDEGEIYDTGKRVVSPITFELVPVYKLVPKKTN